MIHLTCNLCATKFQVPESKVGSSVLCPNCQTAKAVPAPTADAPAVPDSTPGAFPIMTARSISVSASPMVASSGSVSTSSVAALQKLVGGKLGPYDIESILGQGGMGVVFEGKDVALNRSAAIKVMSSNKGKDRVNRERFLREAAGAANLDHENIVPIWYSGEENGVLFMAMPLLRGISLEDRLRKEITLPTWEALHIVRECAAGLSYAHGAGLIHRDIKPGNIFLENRAEQADGFRVRLLDFGLALVVEADHLTQSGLVVGTPAWMAPEQAADEVDVDGRADLFSLGCVMYQMLTGKKPFVGRDVMKIFNALANHHPPGPNLVNPSVHPKVSDLNLRLLEKSPALRPASAAALVKLCDELLLELYSSEGHVAPCPRNPRRMLLIGWLIGTFVTAIVAAVLYWKFDE